MNSTAATPSFSAEYAAEDRGWVLLTICGIFIAFETIFILLRFYSRYVSNSKLGWDDGLLPVAWLTNIALCSVGIASVHNASVGRHLIPLLEERPAAIVDWAKDIFAVQLLYLTSSALPKLSVIALYLRILVGRVERGVCWFLIAFTIANWIAFVVSAFLQCAPLAFVWNMTIKGGHCFNQEAFYQSASLPNIFSDLVIITLPLPTVYGLQIGWRKKIGILVVFILGSVGIISSCVRLSAFFSTAAFTDNTYSSVALIGWSVVEPGMYFLAACLLAMRPLLQHVPRIPLLSRIFPNTTSSGGRSARRSKYGNGAGDSGVRTVIRPGSIFDRRSIEDESGATSISAEPLKIYKSNVINIESHPLDAV